MIRSTGDGRRGVAGGLVIALLAGLVVVAPGASAGVDETVTTLTGKKWFKHNGKSYLLKVVADEWPSDSTLNVEVIRKWNKANDKRLTRRTIWRDAQLPMGSLEAAGNLSSASLEVSGRGYGQIDLDATKTGKTKTSCGGHTEKRAMAFSGKFAFKPLKDVFGKSPNPVKGTLKVTSCSSVIESRTGDDPPAARAAMVESGAAPAGGSFNCERNWFLSLQYDDGEDFWFFDVVYHLERAYMGVSFFALPESGYDNLVLLENLYGRMPKSWADFQAFQFQLALRGLFFKLVEDLFGETEGEVERTPWSSCPGGAEEYRTVSYPMGSELAGKILLFGLLYRYNLALADQWFLGKTQTRPAD